MIREKNTYKVNPIHLKTIVYPSDAWGVIFNVRAAELCRRWDFVKVVPLFHPNRLMRGVQRRFLLPRLVGKATESYPFMWCNGISPIPYFRGDIVIDLDDPKLTSEEVAILNRPNIRSVVVTTDMMKGALEKLGCRNQIVVIPSGVDKKRLESPVRVVENPPDKNVKILGYVSTRIKKEEIDYMVEILDGISRAGLKVQLWLVGNAEGPRLVRRDIRYFDYIPHQEILALIRCFDLSLYIRSEDYGGRFSIKMIESFACGVPVVSVKLSETFLIDISGAGLVCPREDIIQASLALLKDGPRRREMAEKGKLFAKDYDWDKIAGQYRQKVFETGNVRLEN